MYLVISVGFAFFIGMALAVAKCSTAMRIAAFSGIFLMSVFLECLNYFTADPKTWLRTFITGLFQIGLASVLFHVIPAVVAFYAVLFMLKMRQP